MITSGTSVNCSFDKWWYYEDANSISNNLLYIQIPAYDFANIEKILAVDIPILIVDKICMRGQDACIYELFIDSSSVVMWWWMRGKIHFIHTVTASWW
jgi:hypothetical protein